MRAPHKTYLPGISLFQPKNKRLMLTRGPQGKCTEEEEANQGGSYPKPPLFGKRKGGAPQRLSGWFEGRGEARVLTSPTAPLPLPYQGLGDPQQRLNPPKSPPG